MNLMHIVLAQQPVRLKSKKYGVVNRIEKCKLALQDFKIEISKEYTRLGDVLYFYDCLPKIVKTRDVLKKPLSVCKMRVNWEHKPYNITEYLQLPEQYGWTVTIVDSEHTRNKYKNKETAWVIFDTQERAQKAMNVFNLMFITAMEQDAIDEYKKFKENPDKRILSFDKILPTAYDLYEAVDNGEM